MCSWHGATYIAWVENSGILPPDFWKRVSLVTQQPVHIPDESQVLLVSACLANSFSPFFNRFKDLLLDSRGTDGGALGEAAHKLVKELLGADLEMERVAAVLHTDIEQIERKQRDIRVAMVDVVDDGHSCLTRGRTLLGIDQVADLEVEGEVWLVVLRTARCLDESLELGGSWVAWISPAVSSRIPRRSGLHGVCADGRQFGGEPDRD